MKKQLTFLCALLFLMAGTTMGQHYQFPNPSFDTWKSTSSGSAIPRGWHSFSDAEGGWAWAVSNHSNTATDRFGENDHACQIYTTKVLGVKANGAMTLGKMVVASTSTSSDANLIYTKRSDADSSGCRWSMAGRPDSVRLWVKFEMASASSIATCKMHIHGDCDYQDIPSHSAGTAQTGKIANAFCEMVKNNGAVSYGSSSNFWERFDFKFTYYDDANNIISNPTLTNIVQAPQSYILASFSTNKTVGGGSENDKLYFDDMELVYNKKLASLSIGGTAIPASDLLALNNTAFGSAEGNPQTAYNIFNTQGLAVYEYNQPVCAGAFPEVSATAESGLINGITYTPATASDPYTTIVVTHNDGSYYTYKVHFANVQSSPTVTLDNGGDYSVCQNGSLTITASGNAASYEWSNGLGSNATATPPTGTVGTTTYTVTGSTSNGCTTTATATVTVNPLPSITLSDNSNQAVCSGTAINNITATYAGGSASGSNMLGLTFNANNGTISGTPNGSGEYTITVTSSHGCGSATASGTITVNPNPVATLSLPSVTACEGAAITPVIATTSGGTVTPTLPAGLTYNPETGEITGIPEATGTITITTASSNCGTATAQCSVTLTPGPTVTLPSNKNQTLCNSSEFTSITIGYANGTPSVSGLTGTGLTYANGQITGTPLPGSHTYYVTVNSSTCGSVIDSGTVTVTPTPTVTLSSSSFSVCQNAAVEGLSVSPFNSTTQVTGLPAGLSFDNTNGQITGNPTAVGTFDISVTTSTNCGSASTTGTITVKPLPTLTLADKTIEVCDGESVSMNVNATNCSNYGPANLSNGLQFSLNSNSGTVTGTPTTDGTFIISVNSSNNCGTASDTGTVTIKTKPSVSINGPESLCQGATATFTATGDFESCVWDDNSTNAARNITPDQPGQHTYSVTATGSNGCSESADITVNVQGSPAVPNATTVSNSSCQEPYNGSITVTSPTGSNFTYSINGTDFQSGTTFTGLNAGTYTLTVQNTGGCTSTKEITVGSTGNDVNAEATANTYTPCVGGDLELTGSSSTSGVSYAWSGPNNFSSNEQSPTISDLTSENAGTYTLTVTKTATGCSSIASVNVTVKPLPTVTIPQANPAVCPGASVNILVVTDDENTSMLSGLPEEFNLNNATHRITGSTNNSGEYEYIVTTSNACGSATASGTITVYALPAITFTGSNSFCQNSNTTISVQEEYDSYSWSNGGSSQSINVNAANDYSVTVTDANGCQNNATQHVTANPLPAAPIVSITNNTNCDPVNGVITITSPLGEGYTYSIGSSFQDSPVFDELEPEEYIITVKDGNGCSNTITGVEVGDEAQWEGIFHEFTISATNSYEWNGITYEESGNYTQEFIAPNGCDSTVTLHLTIISSVTHDIYETACDSYTWEGETYTESGDYSKTYTAASGVDSVVTLHLTILKPNAGTVTISGDETICQGEGTELTASVNGNNGDVTYTWNNQTGETISVNPTTTTDYSVTATATLTANDVTCTATAVKTFTVTVNMPTTGTDERNACEEFTWIDGITYTENNNTATYTLTNAAGCDSVVTLNLTINHSTASTETVTACNSFTWIDGITYTENNNTATHTLTNAAGCDSVVTLNLTINHSTAGIEEVTACDSYEWHGTTYTSSNNTATFTTTNAAGCDSVVTLNLTINRKSYYTDVHTACNSFTWIDGNTYTESNNTATYTIPNAAGCDSVVTLNLTIYKPANQAHRVTRCETYTWTDGDGETYTQSGTHTYAHTDANGCEQVDTLYLTINPLPVVEITGETSFCEGASTTLTATAGYTYLWGDGSTNQSITVTESGDYTVTVTDDNSCQNTDTIHVNKLARPSAPILSATDNTSCTTPNGVITITNAADGLTYSIDGTNFSPNTTFNGLNAEDFTITVKNENGCVNTASITVNTAGNTVNATANANTPCIGGELQLTAETETTNATFAWSGPNAFTSNVQNPIRTNANADMNGNYTLTVTDPATSCSKTTTVTVTVNIPAVTLADITGKTACAGENVTLNATLTGTPAGEVTYSWTGPNGFTSSNQNVTLNNITAAQGGEYTVVATATQTINSTTCSAMDTKTVNVTVNMPTTGVDEQTACEQFTWINNVTYTESTNEPTITLQAANGCDSVVTLHLTINKPSHQAYTVIAYDSYTWTDGNNQTYTTSGDHIYSHPDDNGCTQVDTLHLTIHYSASNEFSATACESYTWNDSVYTTSGDYVQHLKTVDNADSTVTLHLTVNHGTHNAETVVACESYVWHGTTYNTSGDYTYDYNNADGCESTDTLHLTINNPQHQAYTQTAYDSYTWTAGNGQTYEASGDYLYSHQDANGCTQVDTLHLTIFHSAFEEFSATACESYTWNSSVYTTTGDYVQTFKTVDNADSTVTLHLTINYGTHNVETESACESFTWHGTTYTTNGTHIYEYNNDNNCPSADTLKLTVNQPTTGEITATACESFDWFEQTITESGEYTHTLTGANVNGCDSIVTLHLTINHNVTGDTTAVECNSFDWYDHTNITESCDNLTHTFQAVNGCDSIVTLHLTILKPNAGTLSIDGETTICQGENTQLTASVSGNNGNVSYSWDNQATSASITVSPTMTTDYTVTATATLTEGEATCVATAEKTVTVTVNLPTTGIDEQTTCEEEFTWIDGNTYYESTNTPIWFTTNAAGCDSVVTLHLTIYKPQHQAFYVTKCESYTWEDGNGETYTESGEYLYRHFDDNGCTQVDTLRLTINHGTHQSFRMEACEEYEWHNVLYTESGIFTYQHETSTGDCPDVDTLYLTINKPVEKDTTIQVCFFPYTFMGREYTEPTTDDIMITKIDGSCDSILYHLSVEIISSLTVEGHEYPIVKIGSDCWFAENLRTTEGLSNVSAYNEDESNVELFGRLYNWYDAIGEAQPQGAKAAGTAASACPEGWTIPTVENFENLFAMADNDIDKMKSPDVATWLSGMAGSPDGIEFNAPAGGFYNPATLQFERRLLSSQYWTSDAGSSENEMTSVEIGYYCSSLLFHNTSKDAKLSIRCIKVK